MKYKVLIIEDEEPARILIKNFLSSFEGLEIAGEYADGFSGVKAIDELKPDLVFLDIQMPKLTGLEVLELASHKPSVIFTTAYDEHAVRAFELNAVDYLLKPFSRERFTNSVNKAIESMISNSKNEKKIKSLVETHDNLPEILIRVAVKSGTKVHVIPVDDILYIEAEGDYVKIVTSGSFYLKEKTMKYFETHLDNSRFVRIHRSFIVAVSEISKIEYYDKETHVVFMKNGDKIRASTAGYQTLRKVLHL